MIVHREYKQNTLDWLQARAGVVTASEFGALVTPTWKIADSKGTQTYLHTKVAEVWSGAPLPGENSSLDMDFGKILEDEARPLFQLETGLSVEVVAFITSDDKRVGCSPDGLIGEDGGVEIKSPLAQTHVGYLLDGKVPPKYLAQVHGSMYVTGRKFWYFMSYRRLYPPLILKVERDEDIQAVIHEAVTNFLDRMDIALKRLEEKNGGPSRAARAKAIEAMRPAEPEPADEPENYDVPIP